MILIVIFSIIALYILMFLAFLIGTIKKNNGIIDSFYGLGYIVLITTSFMIMQTYSLRQIIVTILVMLWGARLFIHVTSRNWGKPEDYRYKAMRERFGEKVVLKSLSNIYLFQGLIIILVGFPALFINSNANLDLIWLDFIGIGVWVLGFYFEALGDYQLRKFLKNPKNKGNVMDQGLWKYTQHPNYFGEVTMWWGIYLIALSVPWGFITIFGPIIINFMIIKVSGVRLLNKRYEGDDKYTVYRKKTRAFIPWFPKK